MCFGENQDTLKVGFTLKVFGGIENHLLVTMKFF
jgi:hypothetical protein